MAAKMEFGIESVLMLVLVVIIGLFLFNTFFTKVGEDWKFVSRTADESEEAGLTVIQILIVGAMTFGVFKLAPRIGMAGTKRDAFYLVLVMVLAFLAYKYVMAPILTGTSFGGIEWKLAQKLGMFK